MEYFQPDVPENMSKLNIWAVNYYDDSIIQNDFCKAIMSEVWKNNRDTVHFTEFMSGGHTADIYKSKEMLDWMTSTVRNN